MNDQRKSEVEKEVEKEGKKEQVQNKKRGHEEWIVTKYPHCLTDYELISKEKESFYAPSVLLAIRKIAFRKRVPNGQYSSSVIQTFLALLHANTEEDINKLEWDHFTVEKIHELYLMCMDYEYTTGMQMCMEWLGCKDVEDLIAFAKKSNNMWRSWSWEIHIDMLTSCINAMKTQQELQKDNKLQKDNETFDETNNSEQIKNNNETKDFMEMNPSNPKIQIAENREKKELIFFARDKIGNYHVCTYEKREYDFHVHFLNWSDVADESVFEILLFQEWTFQEWAHSNDYLKVCITKQDEGWCAMDVYATNDDCVYAKEKGKTTHNQWYDKQDVKVGVLIPNWLHV